MRQPLHWLLYSRKEVGYSALFHFQVLSDLFCISNGRANTFRKIKVRFNQALLRALMQREASYQAAESLLAPGKQKAKHPRVCDYTLVDENTIRCKFYVFII